VVFCKYRAESSASVTGKSVFISYARKTLCHGTNNIDLPLHYNINLLQSVFSLSPSFHSVGLMMLRERNQARFDTVIL